MKRVLLVALILIVAAGCGGDETPTQVQEASVYFLLDDQVWPVSRDVAEGDEAAQGIVSELVEGPTSSEAEMGLTGGFPGGIDVEVAGDVAIVESPSELTTGERAQLVYSLIQPAVGVTSVELDGESYARADFEEQTPSVLVESPLPFQEVTSPVRATGTANTFEATFHYELTDTDGRIVDENFVTATSGSGTRGTFEFTTEPFTIPFDGVGALIVFERSAEDGSRVNVVEIPLRMSQ